MQQQQQQQQQDQPSQSQNGPPPPASAPASSNSVTQNFASCTVGTTGAGVVTRPTMPILGGRSLPPNWDANTVLENGIFRCLVELICVDAIKIRLKKKIWFLFCLFLLLN